MKNRGVGLKIENFNSEILNFEASSLKFTFKVTKISDKIDAASSKSAVHNAAKHVLQNSRASFKMLKQTRAKMRTCEE